MIKNDSKLPTHLNYQVVNRILTANFSIDDIAKILQNLDSNKAHGHDKISIRMLQLCGNSLCKPLLFLIYIKDLSEGLSSNAKLFADDTSLFSVIHDSNTSALELNSDLAKINRWAFQWKMSFNPDPKKQAQEVIFSRKSKAISHPPLVFHNNVIQVTSHEHLDIILDNMLYFDKHLETVQCKINKTIGFLRKLQNLLSRTALITLYKVLFVATLIMAIFFMIKPTMHRFTRN